MLITGEAKGWLWLSAQHIRLWYEGSHIERCTASSEGKGFCDASRRRRLQRTMMHGSENITTLILSAKSLILIGRSKHWAMNSQRRNRIMRCGSRFQQPRRGARSQRHDIRSHCLGAEIACVEQDSWQARWSSDLPSSENHAYSYDATGISIAKSRFRFKAEKCLRTMSSYTAWYDTMLHVPSTSSALHAH